MSTDALMAFDALTDWYGFIPKDPVVWLLGLLAMAAVLVWDAVKGQ